MKRLSRLGVPFGDPDQSRSQQADQETLACSSPESLAARLQGLGLNQALHLVEVNGEVTVTASLAVCITGCPICG
jgi:hypothetical protein